MNCRHAQANFSGYLEQELSEEERRRVAAHLARCPRCSTAMFAMQKAMNLVRWVPRVEGSPEFEERLMQRIAAEAKQDHPRGRWRDVIASFAEWWDELAAAVMMPAPAGALVVALLVGGGGGVLLMRSADQNQPAGGPTIAQMPEAGPELTPTAPVVIPIEEEPAQLAQTAEAATPPSAPPSETKRSPRATAARAEGDIQVVSADVPNSPASPASGDAEPGRTDRNRTAAVDATPVGRDVAPWYVNGQPIEAAPEGPPAVVREEYILHLINGRPVEQLPASAVVSGETMTF